MKSKLGQFEDLIGIGGSVCLDFVNTVSSRGSPAEYDRLSDYADLAHWACATGIVSHREAGKLRRAAKADADRALVCFEHALALREVIYGACLIDLRDHRSNSELDGLSDSVFPILASTIFEAKGSDHVGLAPRGAFEGLSKPLWHVAWSAFDLLTGEDIGRLHQCENDGCTWLFIDQSKNHSRRWCSMKQCGTAVKSREYRARLKANR